MDSRFRGNDVFFGEPQAVLSKTKEGSPQFVETATAGILRFALDRAVQGFAQSV
jgi:hypothetical protein